MKGSEKRQMKGRENGIFLEFQNIIFGVWVWYLVFMTVLI